MDKNKVHLGLVKKEIPYGEVTVEVMNGGMATTSGILLEDKEDKNDLMYIANAAVEVVIKLEGGK